MNYTVTIQPGGYRLLVRANETVLQAALRQNYQLPWSCQQAICGTCQGLVLAGQIKYDGPISALNEVQQQAGFALFCSAIPLSDLTIELLGVVEPEQYPIREITCAVSQLQDLHEQVIQVTLAQPSLPLSYRAGQYVELLPEQLEPRPYSLSALPNAQTLELHLRHKNLYGTALLEQIKSLGYLKLKGPFGKLRYQRKPVYPLIFIAAGAGFAPFKALLAQAWQDPLHPPIYLYWGARTQQDLYWHKTLLAWAASQPRFKYCPVLTQPDAGWQGSTGVIYAAVLRDHAQLTDSHVYASGPPEMVFNTRDALMPHGLSLNRFYSDWLDYPLIN